MCHCLETDDTALLPEAHGWVFSDSDAVFGLRVQIWICVLTLHLNFSLNCLRAVAALGQKAPMGG